ncbi:TlpA family protein disulfide reductase [Nocardia sp. CDC159]|uniref:TlpA family protein disulfide reductase n=1 Tax=Nocardia pulmonis TaxID=2951408 RepID=A0A9X2ITJ9_9NOCA|nr:MULTISPECIES: TlpA disulfide reductase family protein [Nocardia]MCM6771892.1 TlpA family protein disulfide reductase [Nocardia pulmonis]MCM6785450.1 TlpA family protein disulfide reductase [Nocardia sp. CDC159]
MNFLIFGVVLVGALCILNLILTVGVIARLREHTDLLSNRGEAPIIGIGEQVGEFETATVDGEPLRTDLLADETLVAFFSPTCAPCQAKLPKFVEHARATAAGTPRPVAVVVGAPEEATEFVAALRPVSRVVLDGTDGTMAAAFQAHAFPTLVKVGPGKGNSVVVKTNRVDLEQPARTAA